MGVPRFYGRVGGDDVDGKDKGWWKSLVYYVVLVGGAVGFWRELWRWTESENALLKF